MRDGRPRDLPKMRGTTPRKPRGHHPHQRLNALRVRSLKAPGRYADGDGLYLFVEPSGAKRWILRTVVDGKRCDIGLGSATVVSLADARQNAARMRRIARDGGDPLAERRRVRRTVPTFTEAASTVHSAHAATFKNAKHKAQWLASLKANVFPVFGDRPVDGITSGDVLKALSPIWTTKPETARRVKQRIKVVLDWAKASGLRTGDNPTEGLTKVLPKHRRGKAHHPALPYQAVPAFIEVLRSAYATRSIRLAFELLILTATRTTEVQRAEWTEFDLDSKIWTIPGARMKSGREHRVPLSARAIEILQQAQTLRDGGPYVFAGRTIGKPLSSMSFLKLLEREKYGTYTTHGFRSSFRDWAAEKTNVPRDVCEAALAHTIPDKTEAAYHRTDLFERRRALMDGWSAFVTTATASVVPIRA